MVSTAMPTDDSPHVAERSGPRTRVGRRLAFKVVIVCGILAASAGLAYKAWDRFIAPGGEELNRLAWEASYTERGLPVPPQGPREGYWGRRVGPLVRDPVTKWRAPEAHFPGLIETDARGFEHVPGPADAPHLMFVGGSVATGAYAQDVAHTYFRRAADLLAERDLPVRVTVCAAGAWRSTNEAVALSDRCLGLRPDVVVFLNGLNDLTTAQALDVKREDRVPIYLGNMRKARDLATGQGVDVLFALQPLLHDKKQKTWLERRILKTSYMTKAPTEYVSRSYEEMRRGLRLLAEAPRTHFVDTSGVLDDEPYTSFADIWHFSDRGHELLARGLVEALEPILRARSR